MLWISIYCEVISRNSINGDTPCTCPLQCPIKQLGLPSADALDGPFIWLYKAISLYSSAKETFMGLSWRSLFKWQTIVLYNQTWFLQSSACGFCEGLFLFFPSHVWLSESCSPLLYFGTTELGSISQCGLLGEWNQGPSALIQPLLPG